jgi:hypothetical protein
VPKPSVPGAAHCMRPIGQVHSLLTQSPPAAQMVPQVPQLLGSDARSAHTAVGVSPGMGGVVHAVRFGFPQPVVHTPALHVVVPMQTWPHAPQLLLSVLTLTQLMPHCISPAPHPHTPPTQLAPTAH